MFFSKKRKNSHRNVLGRYLLHEIAMTLGAVAGVLLLILTSNRLVRYLADAASGELPSDALLTLLSLKSIQYLTLLLPMGFFISVLLVLGRMYRDNEMAVLAACGVSPLRLLRTVGGFAAFFLAILLLMSLFVAPWAAERVIAIEADAQRQSDVTSISAGRFRESVDGEKIFYVQEISEDGMRMHNVFIQQGLDDGSVSVQAPKFAHLEVDAASGDKFLVMEKGWNFKGAPGDANWRLTEYERHAVRVEENEEANDQAHPAESIPTRELWVSPARSDRIELQWRLVSPLTVLVFAVLVVPLARTKPRQGRYGRLTSALLIYLLYSNSLSVARKVLERGQVPEWLGIWWVHVVVLAVAAVLWVREIGGVRWVGLVWGGGVRLR